MLRNPVDRAYSAYWYAIQMGREDKKTFEEAISVEEERLKKGVDFRVSVVGGGDARDIPDVFDRARNQLGDRVVRWGFQESRADYEAALLDADVIVSTARHEFFGISVVEAVAAGAFPLVPNGLAYPEVLGGKDAAGDDSFFYDGSAKELAGRLEILASRIDSDNLRQGEPGRRVKIVEKFLWENALPAMDDELENLSAGERA